jgi:P27 family predicted phage terminase small subunit
MKVLEGNPGRRPLNENEPEFRPNSPRCPSYLQGEARREWRRVVNELYDAGVLTSVDRAALAAYCQCYARWIDAEAQIVTGGSVIKTDKGNLIQSPWVSIANRSLEEMRKFMVEFGMTPSSRSRVKAIDSAREPSLAEILFGAVEDESQR